MVHQPTYGQLSPGTTEEDFLTSNTRVHHAKGRRIPVANHSDCRRERSTVDLVWSHLFFAEVRQQYHAVIDIMGINMTIVFDTIHRDPPISILEIFLAEDDVRMLHIILSTTVHSVRVETSLSQPIETTTGTPQGNSLLLILPIIIYYT